METKRDEVLEQAKRLPKAVRFQDIGEFERLDERVAWVNVYFHFLIGVNNGFIEFCPNNSPPLDDEWLALLWVVRPELTNEIKKRLKHEQFAEEIAKRGAPIKLIVKEAPLKRLIDSAIPVGKVEYWSSLGNVARVQAALKSGEDVNEKSQQGHTALHAAASNGHLSVVEILIAAGADIDARLDTGETACALAEQCGHTAVVEFLRKQK